MPNFENIARLRDHLVNLQAQGREDKFAMEVFLIDLEERRKQPDRERSVFAIRYLRHASNPHCGTAGCLAGHWAMIVGEMHMLPDFRAAADFRLSYDQELFMFQGRWRNSEHLRDVTLNDAIQYLNLVLERRDVMVQLP